MRHLGSVLRSNATEGHVERAPPQSQQRLLAPSRRSGVAVMLNQNSAGKTSTKLLVRTKISY
ncbi:hypothetical protein MICRO8M_70324 [Microbacterium sp. 8M]|nr:hypothetical protein MICRO8M_70324 [Microbacterium sp. 8M]